MNVRIRDLAEGAAAFVAVLALLALLAMIEILVMAKAHAEAPPLTFGPYRAAVVNRVVDGDTYDVQLLIYPATSVSVRLRLRGADTPETRRGPPCEREAGKRATQRVRTLFAEAVVIVADRLEPDGLGRMVATVYVKGPDGVARNVAHLLKREGLAREWTPGYQPWC